MKFWCLPKLNLDKTFLVLIGLFLVAFVPYLSEISLFHRPVLAQEEQIAPGVWADIALRGGGSWHHRATVRNQSTDVDAGFKIGGSWVAPDMIYYGDGTSVNPGSAYTAHTWSDYGYFTILIVKDDYQFSRKVWVAEFTQNKANFALTAGSGQTKNTSWYTTSPDTICGHKVNYTQNVVGASSGNCAFFNMSSLSNYNSVRGQPNGLPLPVMPSEICTSTSESHNDFSVLFPMAGKTDETQTRWSVTAPNGAGVSASWSGASVTFYLNCDKYHSPPGVATIQGRVFWDKNENGMRDVGEEIEAVPGVNFWVSPTWDWSQATDAAQDNCPSSGSYRKTNLTPATTWKVQMGLGVGEEDDWEITSASIVNNVSGSCWSNASTSSLTIYCEENWCRTEELNLSSEETKNVWFGVKYIPPDKIGSVSGRVWDDENGNVCLDSPDESYLSGVGIKLTRGSTTPPETWEETSGADGSYSFEDLTADEIYTLEAFSYPGDYTSVTGWNDAANGSCSDFETKWGTSAISFYLEEGANYRSVGLSEDPGAWLTVINGDVLSNNLVSMSPHPNPIPPDESYFLAADPDDSGGVIIAQGTIRCWDCESPAKINERDWNVENYSGGIPWPSFLDEIDASSGDLVYLLSSLDIPSNAAADTYNGKVVVVDGNITIDGAVTEIEAILAARGMITIEDAGTSNVLEITGALYAQGGFNLARTLNNNRKPAIRVIYDPSYLLSTGLTALQDSRLMEWREVLPDDEEEGVECTPISCTPTNWLPVEECGTVDQTGTCWNGCEVEYKSRTYNYGPCSDKTESCPAFCLSGTSLCAAHTVSCPRACVTNDCQDCSLSCTPYPNCYSCGTESTTCDTSCDGLETCSYPSPTASCDNTCSGDPGVCYDCTPSCGTLTCGYEDGSCGYTFCAIQGDNLLTSSYTTGSYQHWFNNSWNLYMSFTPLTSIKLTSLQVQIRNSGGAWRNVTAKITNSGGTSLTGDGTSDWLRSETKWLTISNFPTKPILEAGQTYRIYVKGPDSWNSLIWFSQNWQNTKPRNHRVYGDECL